jgi:hypothetical protein
MRKTKADTLVANSKNIIIIIEFRRKFQAVMLVLQNYFTADVK